MNWKLPVVLVCAASLAACKADSPESIPEPPSEREVVSLDSLGIAVSADDRAAVFQRESEGLLQMGLSLLVAIFGLLLVGGATALHLGAVDADVLGRQTPARLVTLAAVVNLVAKFLMPLLHPDVMKTTYKKALTGKVMTQTFSQFETKVKEIAVQLAEEVAEDWKEDVRQEILALQLSRPRLLQPGSSMQHPDDTLHHTNDGTRTTDHGLRPTDHGPQATETESAPHPFGDNGERLP